MSTRTPNSNNPEALIADEQNQQPLHANEQRAISEVGDVGAPFMYRFWDLGELKGQKQAVEVGHDGAPVDMFVLDEVSFEAFKSGQQHQYIGGFGITSARHLFQIPFDGKWYLATRPVRADDQYEVAYRIMNFN